MSKLGSLCSKYKRRFRNSNIVGRTRRIIKKRWKRERAMWEMADRIARLAFDKSRNTGW